MFCGTRRYSAGTEAHILWGAGLRAPGEAAELQARLEAAGLPTMDVSAVEAAQVRPGIPSSITFGQVLVLDLLWRRGVTVLTMAARLPIACWQMLVIFIAPSACYVSPCTWAVRADGTGSCSGLTGL